MLNDSLHYPFNRRDFLKASIAGGVGLSMPGIFQSPLLASGGSSDGRILVILELGGGNDGLNTVVPYANDGYHRLRPQLALEKSKLITLNDTLALPEYMADLKGLYDAGNLAIVNGVGYPNPNRSHFRSMEIWHTASDSNRYERNGWIGDLSDQEASHDPLCAIAIDKKFPQSFWGDDGMGIAFEQPQAFRWQSGKQGASDQMFRRLNKASGKHDSAHSDPIHFLRHITSNIVKSSDRVIAAAKSKQQHIDYPQNPLAQKLKSVSQLIGADLPTRVYHVSLGGFDTHVNQSVSHPRLLSQFSESVAAFQKDLKAKGLSKRVITLCYSEFGRRAKENASGGTDHGTAGPMFVIGDAVKPGLHGRYPSLSDLDNNKDLKFNVDFRTVYAEVLQNWLSVNSDQVLGKSLTPLSLIQTT